MGNRERNTYVCQAITGALLEMLETRRLDDIGIGEITARAGVSRNSFYRNFRSKDAIVRRQIRTYLGEWKAEVDADDGADPKHLFVLLFEVVERHKDFFLLLRGAGLLYPLQDEFFSSFGPADEDDDVAAYSKAFFAYSTYGFLETWIRRGMRQTAREMGQMLRASE